ncbi:peroxiredoxin, Ohr subfamily protein, partial [Vibrio parahaemolyticus V-223/04]
GLFL